MEFLVLFRNRRGSDSAHMFGAGLEGASGTFTPKRMAIGGGVGLGVGLLGGAVGLILGQYPPAGTGADTAGWTPESPLARNLFIGFFMGSLGWIGHVARGQVDYSLLAMMGVAAMIGSYIGARFTGRVRLNTLVLVMGVVLLSVGALLVVQALRI